jgi:hypothetical protein
MKPRIPLESDEVTPFGLPNTAGMAPALSAARGELARVSHRTNHVDPVTSELVRIRNARHQNCYF